MVLVGPLEIVDVVEAVEAELLVHAVAVPVGRKVGVDGGRLVAELGHTARQGVDVREVVEGIGVFAVAHVGHGRACQELELRVAGAAAVDRHDEFAAGQGVGKARLEEGRALVAIEVAEEGQVREGLVHHDDDGGLQLVPLRLRGVGLRGRPRRLLIAGHEIVLGVLCGVGGVAGRLVDRQVLGLRDEGGQEALRLEVGDLPFPPVLDLDAEEVLVARDEDRKDEQGGRGDAQDERPGGRAEPMQGAGEGRGEGPLPLGLLIGCGIRVRHVALGVGPVEDQRANGAAHARERHRPEHARVQVVLVAAAHGHRGAEGEDVAEHEHRVFELQDEGLDDAEGGEVADQDARDDGVA